MASPYPRDMVGYGLTYRNLKWPGCLCIAWSSVTYDQEGGENCILHGDTASEAFLSEIVGAQPYAGLRHMNLQMKYQYGSWRRFLAAAPSVHGTCDSGDRVRCRHGARAQPHGRGGHAERRLGDRQPWGYWWNRLPVRG